MSFIQRELDRIHAALGDERTNPNYAELYAAQQALAWALEPDGFRAPLASIMDTQEAREGCLASTRPPSSSNMGDQSETRQ